MQYQKKLVIIEAFQYGIDEMPQWFIDAVQDGTVTIHTDPSGDNSAEIDTLEGTMTANNQDYIIKGIANEIYPCKADIFKLIYDPVNTMEEVNKE